MNRRNFFAELRRRNVYKVAMAYGAVSWLIMQVTATVVPALHLPEAITTSVVVLVLLGLPIALVVAWAYEMTPEGMKRTEDLSPNEVLPMWSRRKFAAFIITILLLATGLFVFQFLLPKPAAATKSIAVLPFENLTEEKANSYFADGIQEEILTRLSRIGELKVISRTSTAKYKSTPDNLRDIAKELEVSSVLEGSVQKSNDAVRVSVQLIDATTDTHLWAETFDRKLTDIFAVESEIAKTVADKLRARLSGSEAHAIASRPTENPEAHRLYLLGRFFWNKRTAADFRKAIDYFEQAIDKDPAYALAYAGLADAYVLLPGFGAARPKDAFPKAKAAARKALELDETLGEAHASLGQAIFAYDFNVAEANREFRRALELSPSYATAHQWYAESGLSTQEHYDKGIVEMKRALELDPLSLIINADLGTIFCAARRYDDSIAQLRKTVEMDPNFYYARWALGQALEMKGLNKEAEAQYKKAVALDGDPLPRALLGHLYGKIGRDEEARAILVELHEAASKSYVSPYNFALVHLGLGEKDEAVRLLEQTYEDRDGYSIAFIKADRLLDPLRGDPRFEALARKVFPPPTPPSR